MNTFKVCYDDQPDDPVQRIGAILKECYGIEIVMLPVEDEEHCHIEYEIRKVGEPHA